MLNEIKDIIRGGSSKSWHDSDYYESRLIYCYEKGHYKLGLELAKLATEHHECNLDMKTFKVKFLIKSEDYEAALKLIDHIQVFDPDHLESWVLKYTIQCHIDKKSKYDFITTVKTILKLEPNATFLNVDLGKAYMELDRLELALKYYEQVPFEHMDIDFVTDYMNLHEKLYDLKTNQQWRSLFTCLTDNFPSNPKAWFLLAAACYNSFTLDEALDYLDYVEALDPKYANIAYLRGRVYYVRRDYVHTIEQLELALEQPNQDYKLTCYLLLGMSYEALENLYKSFEYHKEAYNLYPQCESAVLGMLPYLKKTQKYTLACDIVKKILEEYPKHPELLYEKAVLEAECLDDFDLIDKSFEKAKAYNQDREVFWLEWTKIYVQHRNFEKCSTIILEGLHYLPKSSTLYYMAAIYLIKDQRINEALHHLRTALELNYDQHEEIFHYFRHSWTIQRVLAKFINQYQDLKFQS